MLGFSTIIKLTMGLIVIFVVFGIVHTLFPNAMQSFSNSTHIEFPTFSFGKERQQSEFNVPKNMEENVKRINKSIISQDLITDLTFNNFDGCTLTIENKNGKLRMVVSYGGKTKIYDEDVEYTPCIVDLKDGQDISNYQKKELDNLNIRFVEKIYFKELLLPTVLGFKGYGKEEDEYQGYYMFLKESPPHTYKDALIKIGKDLCFVGHRIKVIKE